jgi:hypothetical protein
MMAELQPRDVEQAIRDHFRTTETSQDRLTPGPVRRRALQLATNRERQQSRALPVAPACDPEHRAAMLAQMRAMLPQGPSRFATRSPLRVRRSAAA